jgi:hypothetical protein
MFDEITFENFDFQFIISLNIFIIQHFSSHVVVQLLKLSTAKQTQFSSLYGF